MTDKQLMVTALLVFLAALIGGIIIDRAYAATTTADAIMELKPGISDEWADELGELIDDEFTDRGLDPIFGVALCFTESGFDPKARNKSSGCAGLFQIHPVHKIPDIYDPAVNVAAGARIWHGYLERNDGDRYKALKRYGQGSKSAKNTIRLYNELKDESK